MKPTNETTEALDPITTTENTINPDSPPTELAAPPQPPDQPADSDTLRDLRTENEQLRATLRFRDAHDQITAALTAAGARSPELLFEASKESLRFDDDGRLRPIEPLLKSLRSKYPEQFATEPNIPPSIDAGSGTSPTGPPLTKEALANMSPNDIAKLDWTEVRRVLTER